MLPFLRIIPESPFWLTANGKYKQAERDLAGMAIMNGVEVEEFTLKRHAKHLQQEQQQRRQRQQSTSPEATTLLPASKDAAYQPTPEMPVTLEQENGMIHAGKRGDQDNSDYMLNTNVKVWDIFKDSKLRIHALVASMFWWVKGLICM